VALSGPITTVGGDAFPRDAKPPGLDIRWSVDRLSTQYRKPSGAAIGRPSMSRAGLQGWAVTYVPQYPMYKNLIVAPEPFIERVTGAVRSMGGRIGMHMLLWVPS
jgi:hypothetical protein